MTTMAQALASSVGASELSKLLESDKFGIVSVKSFGAVGDGVTDDTDAIQDALDYAITKGMVVYFPTGTYLISDALTVTDYNLVLWGENSTTSDGRGVKIKQSSTTANILTISASGESVSGFRIKGIDFVGNSSGTTGNGVVIQALGSGNTISQISIENCSFRNCKENGLYFYTNDITAYVFSINMVNIIASGCGKDNILFEGNISEVTINHIYTIASGYNCMKMIASSGYSIDHFIINSLITDSASSGYYGLYIQNATNLRINQFYSESMVTGQIYIKGARAVKIDGGIIRQINSAEGIIIDYTTSTSEIFIDIPRWINSSTAKHIKLISGGSFLERLYLGSTADGSLTPANVEGYSSLGSTEEIFFNQAFNISKSIPIHHFGEAVDGTWVKSYTGGYNELTVTRTSANNTTHYYNYYIPLSYFYTSSSKKGIKPTSIVLVYDVTGADSGDDITVGLARGQGRDDNTATVTYANITGSYDASHNSAAKRVNSGSAGHQYNTLTFTITTPVWIDFASEQSLFAQITVTEANNATGALSIAIKQAFLRFTEVNF